MNLLKLFLITNLLLFGYVDSDIDGVADEDDLCPDTPFDKLVDENGCDKDNIYWGFLRLQISNSWQIDNDNIFSNYGISSYYNYNNISFSISNSQQSSLDNNNNQSNYRGDLYIDIGYLFEVDNKTETKLTFGSKIAKADDEVGTGENDYYISLMLNHIVNDNLSLFSNISYTLVGDSSTINYQNSFGYSLGFSYITSSNWYSSISYNQATSIYPNTLDSKSISLYNSYRLTKEYFLGLNYNYVVDELSYDHIVTLSLGVNFE